MDQSLQRNKYIFSKIENFGKNANQTNTWKSMASVRKRRFDGHLCLLRERTQRFKRDPFIYFLQRASAVCIGHHQAESQQYK
jgi:hypothetical protein